MEVLPPDVSPDAYPVRRPSTRTYLAGSELVVASHATDSYLALNETASALWERCDGSQRVDAIAKTLAAAYGRAPGDVLADIQATLADFHSRDLVRLHRPDAAPEPEGGHGPFYMTFLRHTVEVRTDDPDVAHNVRRIFGPLLGDGAGVCVSRLAALGQPGGYRAVQDGEERGAHATLRSVVTWLKQKAIRALIDARPDLLWLHAGAVAKGGKVLLCLGEGGSGKSTLVMSLVEDGWAYLSDDVIAYDPVTGGALPFPLAPFYRVWGDELVEDVNALGKVRVEIGAEALAPAALAVSALVFPTFTPDGSPSCQPRGVAAAAVGLADQSVNLPGYSGDPLQACADLASRVPAFDVVHTPGAPPIEVARAVLDW